LFFFKLSYVQLYVRP